jgi:Putative Flp pilus-assembly TadE/G-like
MPSHLHSYFSKFARSALCLVRNEDGNAGALFGIAAIPMMAAAGLAIDYNRVLEAKSAMQSMAERAALFGAALDDTKAKKQLAAEKFAADNPVQMGGLTYNTPSAVADNISVKVSFRAEIDTTLFGVIAVSSQSGQNDSPAGSVELPINARARYQNGSVADVCILALDPAGSKAIDLRGTGDVVAENCGVHSDSNAYDSIYANGNAFLGANFIHAVGGVEQASVSQVNFSVEPEEGQAVFGDPFLGEAFWTTVNGSSGCGLSTTTDTPNATGNTLATATQFTGSKYRNISVGSNRFGKLTQKVVYVFGTVDVKGTLNTDTTGATIVLCGANAKITMGAQGAMKLQAPTNTPATPFAGFAVIGNATATNESTLRGGGSTEFIGIWYTPAGSISMGGTTDFNLNSKYFPVVAKKVYTFGTANVNIKNNADYYDYQQRSELQKVVKRLIWLSDN